MADNKKIAMIAGSAILVVAVVSCIVLLAVNKSDNSGPQTASSSSNPAPTTASVKSIQAICQPTDYQQTCEDALTKEAGNTTDIKSLVQASFRVPLQILKNASAHSKLLSDAASDPETKGPLETCSELFNYAVHDLEEAAENIMGYDMSELDKAVYDVKNWISAANTYQWTCLDEFKDANSEAAVNMKKALNVSMQLTSNALAIVDQVGNMIQGFDLSSILGTNRRLLAMDSDGAPLWMTQGKRRLLEMSPWQLKPTVVVAKDGSGQFKTINDALKSLPRKNNDYVVMYVKEGVYKEHVLVDRNLNKLVMVGDGPLKTRISGSLSVMMNGIGTFKTATFSVVGDDFIAKDIGFENTAGPEGHQAVAFRSQSDRSIMYNCHFDGYQDTVYAHTKRQFYRDCVITGTVDFIFGDSSSIFQNCRIVVRKPMANQQNIVTAHGSGDRHESTAFVMHNCVIEPEPALAAAYKEFPTYLGRPWRPYARTVYLQSDIKGFISPDGWMSWVGSPERENTCFYSEIGNRGTGADTSNRAKWSGIKKLTLADAKRYTVGNFFGVPGWPKAVGVPVDEGLLRSQ